MPFTLAFALAFVTAVTVASQANRRATRRHGGTLNQLAHELRGLIYVRAVLGIVFYGALMAWLFWPRALPWAYLPVPTTLRWLAVALLVPALLFFAWSHASLGDNYRGGVGLHEAHELVTTGAYAHVRHPIYLSFIVIMLLVLLLSASWVLGLAGLLLVGSIAVARIPVEETQLAERFGAAWETYRRTTGRLIPSRSR
jgi:protein-S-isoprenylcysteine O-methyltransferase Ste14